MQEEGLMVVLGLFLNKIKDFGGKPGGRKHMLVFIYARFLVPRAISVLGQEGGKLRQKHYVCTPLKEEGEEIRCAPPY